MSYQVFRGLGYLLVGAVFEGVAEVLRLIWSYPRKEHNSA
jgi:hypothetical protein